MSKRDTDSIDEIIARGRELVEQARQALQAGERLFASLGIDPGVELERLQNQARPEAVAAAQAEIDAAMERIGAEVQRDLMHTRVSRRGLARTLMRRQTI